MIKTCGRCQEKRLAKVWPPGAKGSIGPCACADGDDLTRHDKTNPLNRHRLSWWFPQIPTNIPVPETIILPYTGNFEDPCSKIIDAGNQLGWPIFLRTDYFSGKYNWKDTCYVLGPKNVPDHVSRLTKESQLVNLPVDRWIVRKLIPTIPAFTAFQGELPIVKGRRFYVWNGEFTCRHDKWKEFAIQDSYYYDFPEVSVSNWRELSQGLRLFTRREYMHETTRREKRLREKSYQLLKRRSEAVGAALGGEWSMTWLWSEPENEWYLISMTEEYGVWMPEHLDWRKW